MSDVTSNDIGLALDRLGLRPGDLVVVHSSLSSFGRVAGGAGAVVDALLRTISAGGTLFVPTFTYGTQPFDPATTPSLDGAVTEAVRRRPDAVRSHHPTHAVAGIGPAAAEVLAGHERTTPFGLASPLWRLWERGGRVLLIGVDHRANSMIHVAEEWAKVPYLDRTRVAQVVRSGGAVEEVIVRRGGCSAGFNRIDEPLRAAGRVNETTVGTARLLLAGAGDVVAAAAAMLKKDPAALLCGRA
jgi:aminoglycoside 3-N-acetyltransferase